MLTRPFLTELDQRAAVKGSVDPLGVQAVWTRFGRKVVGNLTTVSTSTRDFTILLLGYWLAEQVAQSGARRDGLEVALAWEQLAGYARALVGKEESFRGTTRVWKQLGESTRVRLSAAPEDQILASQRSYGIFGLYTNPARASGLLVRDQLRLSPRAREVMEGSVVPVLAEGAGREARGLVARLAEDRVVMEIDGRDRRLAESVAKAIGAHEENGRVRALYREHLVRGGPEDSTDGRQPELAEVLEDHFDEQELALEPATIVALRDRASKRGHTLLADQLERIRVCESVMAPLAAAFALALQRDGASVETVARELDDAWGGKLRTVSPKAFADLEGELRVATDERMAARFVRAAQELHAGDYVALLRRLLEQNADVMRARGGAAWIEERKKKLHVRLRYDDARLPTRKELKHLWRHAYFLSSPHAIGREVRA